MSSAKVTKPLTISIEKKPLVGLLVALLAQAAYMVLSNQHLIQQVIPAQYQPIAQLLVSPALGFLAAYLTKHSIREELGEVAKELEDDIPALKAVVPTPAQLFTTAPPVSDLVDPETVTPTA